MKTKTAAASYRPGILNPKYGQTGSVNREVPPCEDIRVLVRTYKTKPAF